MTQIKADLADFDAIAGKLDALRSALGSVIVGQEDAIELLLTALLCRGHVLVIGVPGLAKTLLVRTLARAVGLDFSRIQFTPDMMPSDILGTELIQEDEKGDRHLRFVKGPVFAQLILADEINRTPPKTQSALLEAMAEHQVTAAGKTMRLDEPFVVVATQNPIEQEGTYPLPEAQLDRFMFALEVGYPTLDEEKMIVADTPRITSAANEVEPVVTREELLKFADAVWRMPVSEHVVDYAVRLARATRPDDAGAPDHVQQYVGWGAGPRAGPALLHGAKAVAAIAGDPTPSCEHIKQVAPSVLRHRVLTNYAAAGDGVDAGNLVQAVINAVQPATYG
ncbi:MAG: MoxR family ATPase [Phycisphaeraceae bacterium]|nr:MoxR family ATPase [Phycisphaeraceae bacterium]